MYVYILELCCDVCVCTGAVLLCMCVVELCCDVCVCWNCGVMYVYML